MQDNKNFGLKSKHKTLVEQSNYHNFVRDHESQIKQKEEKFRVRKRTEKKREECSSKSMLGKLSTSGKIKEMFNTKLQGQNNKNRYETIGGQFKRRANRSQYRLGFEYSTELKALPPGIRKPDIHTNFK